MEDLLDPYGGAFKATKGLSTKFPTRVLPTPISEAAIIGIACGMAIGGLRPIVEIMFGDFIMLGADQLLNHLLKYEWMYNNKVKIPVTIRTTMGGGRGYGPTHSQSLEPILASMPGIKIVSPTYYHNPGKLLEHTVLNEPGIKKTHRDFDQYNSIIQYKNYEVAILGVLCGSILPPNFIGFSPIIKKHLSEKKDKIIKEVNILIDSSQDKQEFRTGMYSMRVKTDYTTLKSKLDIAFNEYL